MRKLATVFLTLVFLGANQAKAAGVYKIVDSQLPDAKADSTQIIDIDGSNTVGQYRKNSDNNPHAFLYNVDKESWTAIDPPQANGGPAWPKAVSGNKVVGGYNVLGVPERLSYLYDGDKQTWTVLDDIVHGMTSSAGVLGSNVIGGYDDADSVRHGFIYDTDKQTWKNFDPAGSTGTYPNRISDNKVLGVYYNIPNPNLITDKHVFVYDGIKSPEDPTAWTTLPDMPIGWSNINPKSVFGDNVIGSYQVGSPVYSFLYDGRNWTTLAMPGALRTDVIDISDSNIVGEYTADDLFHSRHAFLYNIDSQSWTNIDVPGAKITLVSGIDGDRIIGYFNDPQGFVYTIPEPSSFALLITALLSGFLFLRRKLKSIQLN